MFSPCITICHSKYWIHCSLFSAEDIEVHLDIGRLSISSGVYAGVNVMCVVLGTSMLLVW